MEEMILKELNRTLDIGKNIYFNSSVFKDEVIYIYPSDKGISTAYALKEFCCMEELLNSYKEYFDIKFSFENIKLIFKN